MSAGSPAVICNATRKMPMPATAPTTKLNAENRSDAKIERITNWPISDKTIWAATGIRTAMISGPTLDWNFFHPYDKAAPTSGLLAGGGDPNCDGGGGGGTSDTGTPPEARRADANRQKKRSGGSPIF